MWEWAIPRACIRQRQEESEERHDVIAGVRNVLHE